jgi:hypothetical protein
VRYERFVAISGLHLCSSGQEREREKREVVVVRYTTLVGEGMENIISCLKVPRQCPLVLLIRVKYYFKVIEVGGAALERNLNRH